ncbi:excalibur calcium-binding domain-containing protein [Austwickia sp. TVS 96-490-7B]|uniref:excalibur calcium-binding domain-containing protein n=1 Tax=Austwickia sp. TVS 96-490-7B TaxID=2830843 RepID=UPI00210448E8|nr:excalibur calcium-binding domain-containing protein [Austwickia sp. TVS 96-490-7B]
MRGPYGRYGGESTSHRAKRIGIVGAFAVLGLVSCVSLSQGAGEQRPGQVAAATPSAAQTVTVTSTATVTSTVTMSPTMTASSAAASTTSAAPAAPAPAASEAPAPAPAPDEEADSQGGGHSGANQQHPSGVYYRSCKEARAAGAAPIRRGQPGYRSGLDRDNDGIACE